MASKYNILKNVFWSAEIKNFEIRLQSENLHNLIIGQKCTYQH